MSSQSNLLPEVEELQVKHIAALAAGGAKVKEIAKETGLSEKQVRTRMATDKYREVMRDIGNAAVDTAKQSLRAGVSDMVSSILDNLKHNLDKKNINAIYPALTILGFDAKEDSVKDTGLTVIIGGEQAKQPINITPQKEEG